MGVGGYLVYKNNSTTEGWKAYTNSKVNFSFKYPVTWYYQDDSSYGGADPGSTYAFYVSGTKADPTYGDHSGNEVFVVGILDRDESVAKNFEKATKYVDGKPVLESESFVQILGNNKIVHLGFKGEGGSYLDQILSTFKFGGQTDTSNWKTFQNSHFTYLTFKYPSDWKLETVTFPATTAIKAITLTTERETDKKASGDYTPGMGWINITVTDDEVDKVIRKTSGVTKSETSKIDNYPVTKLTGRSGVAGTVYFVRVITRVNDKTFLFDLSTQDNDLEVPLTKEFDQILSTVKFTQ